MWELTSVVPVGTEDFIKFLTPQGYKSGYHCKCFKLFKLSKCSMLSPRPCTSHSQTTLNHMSLTAFTLLFALILFLLHITPAISTVLSNSISKSTPRGFSAIGLWLVSSLYSWFYWFIFIIPFFIKSKLAKYETFLCLTILFSTFYLWIFYNGISFLYQYWIPWMTVVAL